MHTAASKMALQIKEGFDRNAVIKRIQSKISKYEKKKKKLVLLTPTAAHFLKEMYRTLLQI